MKSQSRKAHRGKRRPVQVRFTFQRKHLCTLGSLTDGYGIAWHYAPFPPRKIDGTEYCLPLEAPDPDYGPMALPFSVLTNTLADMQDHLPTP